MKHTILFLLLFCACFSGISQHAETIKLNGIWEFEQSVHAFPPASFTRTIPVPGLITLAKPRIDQYDRLFPISNKPDKEWFGSGANDDQYEQTAPEKYEPRYNWYRRSILIPREKEGKEVVLTLKKSKYVTQVFVNGQDMGTSIACYTPIDLQVTRAIQFGEVNEVLIRVGDFAWLPPEAAGSSDKEKQNYIPGIWDDVQLSFTEKIRIHRCLILPDINNEEVNVKLQVQNFYPSQQTSRGDKYNDCTFDILIRERSSGRTVSNISGIEFRSKKFNRTILEQKVPLKDAHLWTPSDPFLYEAIITMKDGGESSDILLTRFGMREFGREGRFFTLNGERIYLRGTNVTLHRFFEDPDCNGLPWDSNWVQKLLIHYPKQLHWNAMRVCVGIAPDQWYDIADEQGLLFQNEWLYWQERGWDEQIRREYTDWVWSDGNHPSIAIWDALNENWIEYIGNELIPELKELDPTRIWDAGYMTSAHMGNDEMDEPHTYTAVGYRSDFKDYYDRSPYALGDLHDWTHIGKSVNIHSSAAQLVNEYAWMWLWRNGHPAKLTIKNYQYYLGDEATPDERRELQAYWTQLETEWHRVERMFAGVLSFCYLTNNYGYTGDWFINDIKDLEAGPSLHWQAHCFAPVASLIDHVDMRYTKHTKAYEPGARVSFNLIGVNDTDMDINDKTILKLLSSDGKVVWEEEFQISVGPYGKKYVPVSLSLPEGQGGYTLVSECYSDANRIQPVVSRRYINVGELDNYDYFAYPVASIK